jgi:hypothetical protein
VWRHAEGPRELKVVRTLTVTVLWTGVFCCGRSGQAEDCCGRRQEMNQLISCNKLGGLRVSHSQHQHDNYHLSHFKTSGTTDYRSSDTETLRLQSPETWHHIILLYTCHISEESAGSILLVKDGGIRLNSVVGIHHSTWRHTPGGYNIQRHENFKFHRSKFQHKEVN